MQTHRVVDLDGLAGIEDVDVVGSGGPLADRVFSQAEHGVQVLGESVADSGIEGTKNAKKAHKKKIHEVY